MAIKSKKITAKELTTLQNLNSNVNEVKLKLANIEIGKHEILTNYSVLKEEMNLFSQKLEKKYGSVNVSLTDGAITEQE